MMVLVINPAKQLESWWMQAVLPAVHRSGSPSISWPGMPAAGTV